MEAGADFGQNESGLGTKVVIEHTNINSNKAAHVGHLRNSCIGDTVVRMLRSQGYTVEAENYIDDSGVQVADVVVGFTLLQQGKLHLPEGNQQLPDESFDYFCSRVYVAVGKAYDEESRTSGFAQNSTARYRAWRGARKWPRLSGHGRRYLASDVQAHLKTMSRFNVSYDLLTWESAILHAGLWKRTFEMLRKSGLWRNLRQENRLDAGFCPLAKANRRRTKETATATRLWCEATVQRHTPPKTSPINSGNLVYRMILKLGVQFHFVPWGRQQDGRLLWTMRTPQDSPETNEEEADPKRFGHAKKAINVIDVRQSYPQQVVYESLRRLGFVEQAENSIHLAYEVVTLSATTAASLGIDTSDGRDFYAMSGRKGIEIKADDLINAAERVKMLEAKPDLDDETAAILAASAIRYFMMRYNLQQVIALDIDEALRPNGDTGVYLQYAYARANSILRRLEEANYEIPEQLETLPEQLEQSEWELLRHIDAYPRTLAEASEQLAPLLLAAYVYDLAAHFSDFYEHTPPILKETDERVKAFRASVVQATVQTMDNALRVLGFVPLKRI